MDLYNFLMVALIYAPSVIFAITLHEAAHGYVARYFGDTTAYTSAFATRLRASAWIVETNCEPTRPTRTGRSRGMVLLAGPK